MEEYLKILEEAKTSEDETLIHFIVITVTLILFDLSHLWLHFNFPVWLRPIYTILFLCCYYVLVNRYYRKRRLKREFEENQQKEQERIQQNINKNFRKLDIVMQRMNSQQIFLLRNFVIQNSPVIDIMPQDINTINFIENNGLYGIKILGFVNPLRYQAEITEDILEVLKIYFSNVK